MGYKCDSGIGHRLLPHWATVDSGYHSLGGAVAIKQWLRHEDDLGPLVIVASYPAGGDTVQEKQRPVLSIAGDLVNSAVPEEVRAGAQRFGNATLAWVQGMNHYDWCDAVTQKERDKENSPHERPADESRSDAWRVIDAYLDAEMMGSDQDWSAQDYAGVTLE